jgi:hypothetical protein
MYIPDSKNRAKRGKIKGWSYASRRRLRQLLVSADLAGPSLLFGVTLTCPWDVKEWGTVGEDWRLAMMAFSQAFIRTFKSGSMVYRTELQQRGAPHLHAVVYLPKDGDWIPPILRGIEDGAEAFLKMEVRRLWSRAMSRLPWTENAAKGAFDKRGVFVDSLRENKANAMRYVCDHASKRKQAQLGWEGRQWGVIGGKNLVKDKAITHDCSERASLIYARLVSRLVRYRIRDGRGPFGSWLSHRRPNLGTVIASRITRNRLWEFANREAERTPGKPLEHAELLGQVVGLLE